jgi:opacity protein-like surface antigen
VVKTLGALLVLLVVSQHECAPALARDDRAELPPALRDAYLEVGVGALTGDFGASQFQAVPGYTFESAELKPAAVRLAIGSEFGRYLAAQISYLRPLEWVRYNYRGADLRLESASVRLAITGLTLRPRLPVTDRLLVYGEAGASIVTRSGIDAPDGTPLVEEASYVALVLGGGIEYRVNDHWAVTASAVYSPGNASEAQPATSLFGAGFSYRLQPGAGQRRSQTAPISSGAGTPKSATG